ncbi:aryl-alcohol dehydrogenase-like predicted oxidoreductase [Kribbella antiqua]|uniref:Aryl-alcohol dehydrogenase-like predicted oxidoreductase n=1 Tax=Kribbella antiqua TaxID=2512217 RepID=A0A4R2IQN8_9ACTN|nr:aldo/keto reductase [Kribbella antiqua]TCO47544.1 aryl-alcohol dehydrogenase-like predicted oxidoreductase [Kribbella antiqua]
MTESMTLGQTEVRVSRLGLGAMVWGDMSTAPRWNPARNAYGPTSTAEEQQAALETSLAAGVNFVDTAAMYGKGASERRVGELTEGRDVVVATKFPFGFLSRTGSLPATLDGSLARLRRTTIDLYQVHFPVRWMSIPKLMDLMADAVEAGKVRAVGVSNYNAEQMRAAHAQLVRRGLVLASNQVQYSLLRRNPETDGVLDACRELGVTLIAYMPLASGALTGKYSASNQPAGWRSRSSVFRNENLPTLVQLLREIGERHDRTPSQVALRWLIQQDAVLPIPGAKNSSQAIQNAGALTFTLDDAEVEALRRGTDS